jgi:hypothetical protein
MAEQHFLLVYGAIKGGNPEGGAVFLACDYPKKRIDLRSILVSLLEDVPGTKKSIDLSDSKWANVETGIHLREGYFRAECLMFILVESGGQAGSVEMDEKTKTIYFFVSKEALCEFILRLNRTHEDWDSERDFVGDAYHVKLGARTLRDTVIAQVLFTTVCAPESSGYDFAYILRKLN